MRILCLTAISILLLSGCASNVDRVETRSQEVERSHLNLPAADPLDLDDHEWFVVTPDNAQELFEYLKRRDYDPVIFGLTDQGYEKLSIDFAKIRQHINTQRNILLRYKEYYEEDTDPPTASTE